MVKKHEKDNSERAMDSNLKESERTEEDSTMDSQNEVSFIFISGDAQELCNSLLR